MLLAILSLLVGAALAQRFKMLILAPAILLTLALAIGVSAARAEAPGLMALTATAAIACVQFGYILGLGIRQLRVMARANRMRATSFPGSVPTRRAVH